MSQGQRRLDLTRPMVYDGQKVAGEKPLILRLEVLAGFSSCASSGLPQEYAPAPETVTRMNTDIDVEEYYLRYAPMVLRRCRRMLGNEERARDALQEVFIRLLTHQTRLRHGYPSSLLFRMATNICLNMIRDQRTTSSLDRDPLLEDIAAAEDSEPRAVFKDLLGKVFGKEKPSTREMVYLHYVDGMTLREVARETGFSVSGVRKRIQEFRSRAEAKKEIYYGR
ncbi:MAG TPA: sigma-70 family RNA polymerase sigma factor [Acidobacteriota bacterium]